MNRPAIQPVDGQALSPGARKAAIFVLAVGDEIARELFTRLTEDEIRYLGDIARGLQDVNRAEVVNVMHEFQRRFEGGHIPKRGAGGMFRLMIEKALGEERARILLEPDEEVELDPFAICNSVDVEILSKLLEAEHAQTVAIVLEAIDPGRASRVLQLFEAEKVSDVVYRMARIANVPEDVRREVGKTFAAELTSMNLGGPVDVPAGEEVMSSEMRTVNIVKALPPELQVEMLEKLEERDEEFARDIKNKLFTFEDLVALDGRSMQRLLRELDSKSLAVAMKGATDAIGDLIYGSMSSRAAEMLRDDIDAMGPTRLADVEEAQQGIVEVAMRLEEEGVLTIPRGGDGDVV